MIDQGKNLGRVNIKDIVALEPPKKSELPFDPNKIPPHIWEYGVSQLSSEKHLFASAEYYKRSANMMILSDASSTSQHADIVRDVFRQNEERLKNKLDQSADKRSRLFLQYAAALKTISPTNIQDLKISNLMWNTIATKTENDFGGTKYFPDINNMHLFVNYLNTLKDANFIKPENMTQKARFYKRIDDIKSAFQFAKSQEQDIVDQKPEKVYLYALEIASALKVIDPSILDDMDIGISDWERWNNGLRILSINEDSASDMDRYFDYAVDMLILESDKIIINDKGVKIIMPKPRAEIENTNTPVPVGRKF
jgi:hypothetical protein